MATDLVRGTLALVLTLACAAVARAGPTAGDPHRGGKLRLLYSAGPGTIDPQVNYTQHFAQVFQSVYDGLLTFRKAAGSEAFTIVPDLAEAIPPPEDGGKRYVFKLRKGIRFSDGRELTVHDVVASFRRIFKVNSPTSGTFYAGIVGATACLKSPATCTLAGGVEADAKAGTVTFRLTAPDAEFYEKIAFVHAYILPADTPARDLGLKAAPGTGAYRIVSYDPKRQLKLVRNPHFKEWSDDAQPDGYVDEVDYDYGLTDDDQVTAIANGQADWMFGPVPTGRLTELSAKFPAQLKVSPTAATAYVMMNTREAPFDRLPVRQAVNLAIDRHIIVKLYGGPNLAVPTCQMLPPGIAGYEPHCPWTRNPGARWSGPDMARARQLVQASGTAGQKVTLIVGDQALYIQLGLYVQSVLREMGYDAALRTLSPNIYLSYVQNSRNRAQISITEWLADYPAASSFLQVQFACSSFREGSDASVNTAGLCDPALDAEMARALSTGLQDRAAAAAIWAAVDRRITELAPVASLVNPMKLDFVSRRLGNYVFSGLYLFIYAKAWVR